MSYDTAHRLVARNRGKAREWSCALCAVPAEQWAYNHDAHLELVSDRGHPFSYEPDDYIPLCRPCHRSIDRPGGYYSVNGIITVPAHPRNYGSIQRDGTPHLFQN